MRFNPRAAPEFVEEERNLGRDDPESKQAYDEKKRKEAEKREQKMAGLQHLKIHVADMRDEGEFDSQEGSTELSERTGPASSTGSPLDVAVGAKTGTGSSMSDGGGGIGREVNAFGLLRGEVAVVSNLLKDETLEDAPRRHKDDRMRGGKDETISSVSARQAGERAAKRRKGMDDTTETYMNRRQRKKGKLRTHPGRNPGSYTGIVGRTKELVGESEGYTGPQRLTTKRHKGEGGSKNLPHVALPDPRESQMRSARREVEQSQPVQPFAPPIPFQTGTVASREVRQEAGQKPTKKLTAHKGPPEIKSPPVPKTPMGADFAKPKKMPHGRAGMGGKHKSPESILASEEVGKARAKLSAADVREFKWTLREMRNLLRERMRKSAEDEEHDDARPTPNAHKKTTSSNHGWNDEPDPDDDPRYWGSHPYGLLTGRRGHG